MLPAASEHLEAQLREDRGFVYLARQQSHDIGVRVDELELAGIQVLDEPKRTYPAGPLAAQIVGFAGTDNTGLSGLERQYDALLAGLPGQMVAQHAPRGLEISSAPRIGEAPVAGTDLVLTIDSEVQATTERLLAEAQRTYRAKGVSAVVVDVKTNEILAMASLPNYEPSKIGSATSYARRNRVVTDAYEPGSVNKAITAAAALEEGVVTARTKLRIGSSHTVGGKTFHEAHATDRATVSEIMRDSSNIGTIKLAQRLGPRTAAPVPARVRLRAGGPGWPSRARPTGCSPMSRTGPEPSLPTIAIGHGVSASLLQVAQVYATLARGGVARDPVLVRGTVGTDGTLERSAPGKRPPCGLAAHCADDLAHARRRRRRRYGYERGGARVPGRRQDRGPPRSRARTHLATSPGRTSAASRGFAPADRPEVVVAVSGRRVQERVLRRLDRGAAVQRGHEVQRWGTAGFRRAIRGRWMPTCRTHRLPGACPRGAYPPPRPQLSSSVGRCL